MNCTKEEWMDKKREERDIQNEIERTQKSIATYQELIGEHERVLALLKDKLAGDSMKPFITTSLGTWAHKPCPSCNTKKEPYYVNRNLVSIGYFQGFRCGNKQCKHMERF